MNNALNHSLHNSLRSNEHSNFQSTVSVLAESRINQQNSQQSKQQEKQQALIHNMLSSFTGHGLDDLNNANLMSRVDTKFILPISFLAELLQQVKEDYTVLDIDQKRIFSYHNQYLDSDDMRFYQDHHNGKLNRFKIRRRNYLDTNTEYLEVKFKNNKKRTIKTRIKLSEPVPNKMSKQAIAQTTTNDTCSQFISHEISNKFDDAFISQLSVKQQGGYRRIALANEQKAERLTLDFDLWYKKDEFNKAVQLPGFFIAELKQNKKSKRSPFYQLMTANNIAPVSFSKYCIGCSLLYGKQLKSNKFKSLLSRINQFSQLNLPQSQMSN